MSKQPKGVSNQRAGKNSLELNSLELNGWAGRLGKPKQREPTCEWSKGGARESLIRRLAAYVGSVTQGFCKFFYKQKPGVELNYTRLPLSEPERSGGNTIKSAVARSDPQASKIMAGGGRVATKRNEALAKCRAVEKADKVACR